MERGYSLDMVSDHAMRCSSRTALGYCLNCKVHKAPTKIDVRFDEYTPAISFIRFAVPDLVMSRDRISSKGPQAATQPGTSHYTSNHATSQHVRR